MALLNMYVTHILLSYRTAYSIVGRGKESVFLQPHCSNRVLLQISEKQLAACNECTLHKYTPTLAL